MVKVWGRNGARNFYSSFFIPESDLFFTRYMPKIEIARLYGSSIFVYSVLIILLPYTAAAAAKSLQSCPTLCDPRDGSPLGSPIPGILQARILEWVSISFSNAWKWKVKEKSLSRVRLLTTSWTAAHQAPQSMGFSRQEYWSGVPLPSPYRAKEVQNLELEPCLINETPGAAEVEAERKLQLLNLNYWRGKIELCLVRCLFLK